MLLFGRLNKTYFLAQIAPIIKVSWKIVQKNVNFSAKYYVNHQKIAKVANFWQICGQYYKHFTLVNYDSRVVIWGIFQSGTTLES